MKKHTAAEVIPTVAGTPFAGGFYVGRFFLGSDAYALVVAPKTEASELSGPWSKAEKKVAGARSYNDGVANTAAMVKAGSALAKSIRALDIGGFDDWYLPSRLESLLLFGELQGLKSFKANAFERDWYWTSTPYAGDEAYAWIQTFNYGDQNDTLKSYHYRARAVRRVKI
ncbi:MAG TPA: DUF1566 domain-containing protein [Burkholderiales bacterium]|nr:DUF1566 domain-containing protein [Burkholderiales bacterium]